MSYDIGIVEAAAAPFVYLERSVPRDRIGEHAMPALDTVWAAVRAAGVETGRNVFVYRGGDDEGLRVQFGVEVKNAGPPPEDLEAGRTPSGPAVHTRHTGTYDNLHDAFEALRAWAAVEGRALSDVSWEVYGDWGEDVSTLETDVYVLLA